MDKILRESVNSGTRLHVHLSSDVETAIKEGSRHGEHIVLKIKAERMASDGFKFYLSNNGVWLTEFVPIDYISVIE